MLAHVKKMLAHRYSWKNVLMEIKCAMPVKAVESFCPMFVLLPCFFSLQLGVLELPDVKINNLFSHDASFKYRNVISHVLKKFHLAT